MGRFVSGLRSRSRARTARVGLRFVWVALSLGLLGCASSTPQNGFTFGRNALAAQAGQGIVGDTHVSRLVRQVVLHGDTQPEGYRFYVYPYFASTGPGHFERTREAAARELLAFFRGVNQYSEADEKPDVRRESALFVLRITDESALEQLSALKRLDVSEAGKVVVDVYDYAWAQDQIAQLLHDHAIADTPLRPVSLVIAREPLDGRKQMSTVYVVPIEHADTAGSTMQRVERALRESKGESVLPTEEDFFTRFVDSVGALALITVDSIAR